MQAVSRFEVNGEQVHLDSSSFSVAGDYVIHSQEGEGEDVTTEPISIRICRGYSRDHRPNLKQFLSRLICSAEGGIPLWLKVASGHASNAQQFAPIMSEFARNWDLDSLFVIDAAFYTQPNLEQLKGLNWLSRVPQTSNSAKGLVPQDTTTLVTAECTFPDYPKGQLARVASGLMLMLKPSMKLLERFEMPSDSSTTRTEPSEPTSIGFSVSSCSTTFDNPCDNAIASPLSGYILCSRMDE